MNYLLIFTICSGFISGLSLLLTGSTLNFYILKFGLDKKFVGLFGLVGFPYIANFLWMPIFDKIKFRYKAFGLDNLEVSKLIWLTILLLGLSISIAIMGLNEYNLQYLAIASIFTSFFSASKDGLLGGLKANILNTELVYRYSGIYIVSYRIGMLFSGAGGIYLVNYLSFASIYILFSVLTIVSGCLLCYSWIKIKLNEAGNISKYNDISINNHQNQLSVNHYTSLKYLIDIIRQEFNGISIYGFVIFLLFYRIADNLIAVMINAFLLDQNYSSTEIALYSKTIGTFGSIIGGTIAGKYMEHQSHLKKYLKRFGLIHIFVHFLLIIQAIYGKNNLLLITSVLASSITGGITMSFYMATIILKSTGEYKATKYAFYTSIMGLSRVVLPVMSGFMIMYLDWTWYFTVCIVLEAISLYTIKFVR